MKYFDYKIIKWLLVGQVFSSLSGLYLLIMAVKSGVIFQVPFIVWIICWSPFIFLSIFHYLVNKKIEVYNSWLQSVIKESYINEVCNKYKIEKNDVMPLHYVTNHLGVQSVPLWTKWLNVTMAIFIFTDNQLFVYEEIFNPAKEIIESKTSNYYYYSDITNFKLEERSGVIGVKFTAGSTTFDECFACEDGDGTYDSIMFLQDSIKKHHKM